MIFFFIFLRPLFLKERKDTDIIRSSLHDKYPGSQNPGNICLRNPVYTSSPNTADTVSDFIRKSLRFLIASESRHRYTGHTGRFSPFAAICILSRLLWEQSTVYNVKSLDNPNAKDAMIYEKN